MQEERFADEATARMMLEAMDWKLDSAMESYVPPVPPSPMVGRAFDTSNFKRAYATAEAPEGSPPPHSVCVYRSVCLLSVVFC